MNKIPFWCPYCKKTIEPLDYKFIQKYGVCGNCYINYIDGKHEDEPEENILKIIEDEDIKYVRKN